MGLFDVFKKAKNTKISSDPVCGMNVSAETAQFKSEYKGKTYVFCSAHCKQTFDENPSSYAEA